MSNRTFKVLGKSLQLKLREQYGNLNGLPHGWLDGELDKSLAISYFDRWFNEDEFYLLDDINDSEHQSRVNRYYSFLDEVASRFQVYSYRITTGAKKSPMRFRDFTSMKKMHEYFRSTNYAQAKQLYPRIVIPECNAAIHEAYDYYAVLAFKNENEVSTLIKIAKNSGLYVLEWRDSGGKT